MAAYKKTEITIETDQVWIVRKSHSAQRWCSECEREVSMIEMAQAETMTRMTGLALRSYAEARGWHLSRGEDGSDLICLQSWLNSMLSGGCQGGEDSNLKK